MSLRNKYKSLIEMAETSGVTDLNVEVDETTLRIEGTAPNAVVIYHLWAEFARLDPGIKADDLILNIRTPQERRITYTVKPGDNLRKIGRRFKMNWRELVEANRDFIRDSYKVRPGNKLIVVMSRGGGITSIPPRRKGVKTRTQSGYSFRRVNNAFVNRVEGTRMRFRRGGGSTGIPPRHGIRVFRNSLSSEIESEE